MASDERSLSSFDRPRDSTSIVYYDIPPGLDTLVHREVPAQVFQGSLRNASPSNLSKGFGSKSFRAPYIQPPLRDPSSEPSAGTLPTTATADERSRSQPNQELSTNLGPTPRTEAENASGKRHHSQDLEEQRKQHVSRKRSCGLERASSNQPSKVSGNHAQGAKSHQLDNCTTSAVAGMDFADPPDDLANVIARALQIRLPFRASDSDMANLSTDIRSNRRAGFCDDGAEAAGIQPSIVAAYLGDALNDDFRTSTSYLESVREASQNPLEAMGKVMKKVLSHVPSQDLQCNASDDVEEVHSSTGCCCRQQATECERPLNEQWEESLARHRACWNEICEKWLVLSLFPITLEEMDIETGETFQMPLDASAVEARTVTSDADDLSSDSSFDDRTGCLLLDDVATEPGQAHSHWSPDGQSMSDTRREESPPVESHCEALLRPVGFKCDHIGRIFPRGEIPFQEDHARFSKRSQWLHYLQPDPRQPQLHYWEFLEAMMEEFIRFLAAGTALKAHTLAGCSSIELLHHDDSPKLFGNPAFSCEYSGEAWCNEATKNLDWLSNILATLVVLPDGLHEPLDYEPQETHCGPLANLANEIEYACSLCSQIRDRMPTSRIVDWETFNDRHTFQENYGAINVLETLGPLLDQYKRNGTVVTVKDAHAGYVDSHLKLQH